jgi:hypothetical protein
LTHAIDLPSPRDTICHSRPAACLPPRASHSVAGDRVSTQPSERPPQLAALLAEGRLREQPFTSQAVAVFWTKAVEGARDAMLEGMSVDGALRSAYDAGHLAALALLAAHGFGVGDDQGQQEAAFAGAAALGHPGLYDLVPRAEEIRNLREGSIYDPVIASEAERERAVEWVRAVLSAVRAALVARDPALRPLLKPVP